MLPQSFTYLNQFPLTVNHKIDYQQLPLPGNKEHAPKITSVLPQNRTELLLIYLWEKVLDIEPINISDDFFDLGGDSYKALSIIAELESLMGKQFSISLIFEQPTIAQLSAKLAKLGIHSEHSSLLNLVYDESKPVLFCIASGHGDIMRYSYLAKNLADEYAFYMLQPQLIKDDQQDLEVLVNEFVHQMLKTTQPPYRIAGFSIAGITALEVARSLKEKGYPTQPPILIDTIYPIAPGLAYWVFKWMTRYPQLVFWKNYKIHGRRQSLLYADRGLLTQLWAVSRHRIEQYPDDICLISSSVLQRFYKLFFRPWHNLIEGKIIHYICRGNHGSLFTKQHCAEFSKLICKCLQVSK